MKYTVFYAGLVYEESDEITCSELPDGVYIHLNNNWFHKDKTHIPLSDVPPELQLLILLLT